jgi:hypothetical protein
MRQPGILHRLDGSRQPVVDEGIHVAGFLGGHVVLDLEALDLARELAGQVGRVEAGDPVDATAAGDDGVPAIGHRVAHGTDEPQARDDDAAARHGRSRRLAPQALAHDAISPSGAQPRSRSRVARW